MSRKSPETYAASVARLKALVARLESAQVDVDELESVVKESVDLVTVCRARLRATQSSVDTLLTGLQEDASVTAPSAGAAMVPVLRAAPASPLVTPLPPPVPTVKAVDDYDPFAED